jgi:hypothetical protein
MKRFIVLIGLIILSLMIAAFLNSCGGGAGDDYTPPGINPGQPAELRLYPDRNVAQTGTYVSLRAFLIDANGSPVSGQVVNFTNHSIYGVLSSTTATTDSQGVATVQIRSTTDGIATVVVESSGLRDRRSIVFTSYDIIDSVAIFPVTVQMDVDGDGDGVYNESEDLILFEAPGDDTVLIRATVSVFGQVVSEAEITFSDDHPDAYFPDGTDIDGDGKGDYKVTYTDSYGRAYATVKVEPSQVITTTSVMNVYAVTGYIYIPEYDSYFTGYGSVSIFLEPIVIDQVQIYANPEKLNVGDSSDLTIGVRLSTGDPAPDGTTVQLSATCGSIDKPFVQTDKGNASAKFTAPMTPSSCTVTATAGGVSDSVVIDVVSDLQITGPTSMNEVSDSATFSVSGGTGPYTITFTNDATSANPIFNEASPYNGTSITLTTDNDCSKIDQDTQVTITVTDSLGAQDSLTVTVLDNIVSPRSAQVCENTATCSAGAASVTFNFCGQTPYDVTSSDTNIIADQLGLTTPTFTIDPTNDSVTADTDVTLTVTDNNGATQDVVVTVINQ